MSHFPDNFQYSPKAAGRVIINNFLTWEPWRMNVKYPTMINLGMWFAGAGKPG
jgi:hypothetical protein